MANLNTHMIYIDASRYSNTGKRTGVENYSYSLINELIKKHGEEITLISPRKIKLNVEQIVIPFPRLWTLIRLSWEILRKKEINNLFVPSHVLPIIHPKNSTITIHDVVFKYSPKSYSLASRLYLDWATKYAVKNAKKIIVPSEATKQDLIKFYKAMPEKISVIHLGFKASKKEIGQRETKQVLEKYGLEEKKYFLYIGRLEYKKNTDNLIKAFKAFARNNKDHKLVLVGFPGYGGQKIIDSIPAALDERIILTGYINGPEKEALMQNALCFVFPSRFEGFGLPLLEAMDAGLPIIASDISTTREVAADSALYFDKENHKALETRMHELTDEKNFTDKLLKNHTKNLERFSWEKCASEVYKKIVA